MRERAAFPGSATAPGRSGPQGSRVGPSLVDITCDSDGKISSFIDLQDTKDYLTLHPLNNKPYYLGVYLTGAYQDIMGDLHNLFGRVNEVHVFLEDDEPNGFYIEEALSGSRCRRSSIISLLLMA